MCLLGKSATPYPWRNYTTTLLASASRTVPFRFDAAGEDNLRQMIDKGPVTANIELWDNSGERLQLLITTEAVVMSLEKGQFVFEFYDEAGSMVVLCRSKYNRHICSHGRGFIQQ